MDIDCPITINKNTGFLQCSVVFYRAINYDEKDPFLCNACGFCKYAKFDFTLTAKPCCAVDPIENEEDRKKVIHNKGFTVSLKYDKISCIWED